MRAISRCLSCLAAVAMMAGCANSAQVRQNSEYQVETLSSNQRYVVEEPLQIQQSETTVGRFNSQMIFLTDQLERNVDRKSLENTFIVTSFSNLDDLSETTAFGRLVGENVIHELQVRKWKVFEVRLAKDITVNEAGEFSLSRDVKKIKEMYKVGGIVTGTYSLAGNHIIVNSRVIDIGTGVVTSSAQIYLPRTSFLDTLLYNRDKVNYMKIVGDTPYSCRDIPTCWGGDVPKQLKIEGHK